MIGKMTVRLEDLPMYKIPIFIKATGVKLTGVFFGIKKTVPGNLDIFVIQTKDACYGRIGHHGEQVVAMPGDLVGTTLTGSAKASFDMNEVKEGDVVSLVIHGWKELGDGRSIADETFTKVEEARPAVAAPTDATRSSRSWTDIVASAKYAYSSTGGDLRGRMLLLAGSIIDFEADRDLVRLVEQAQAAKKAYHSEYVEHGSWKEGDDGESNATRWKRAAEELAKAMLDDGVV